MRIGRTLPPAASPVGWKEFFSGLQGWVRGAAEIDRFEQEIKTYFDVSSVFLLSSGKAALTIALSALKDLSPDRDEVLIPAYTCYSVPSAVIRAGLKVRLCDLNPDSLDFDHSQLAEELKNKRLLCVIPGHLFGDPVDIEHLKGLAEKAQVPVLEDAAQAFGAQNATKKLGTLGDVGIFSLGRGKAFSTVEGGIIVTRREDLARQIQIHYTKLPEYGFGGRIKLVIYALVLIFLLRPTLFWIPRALPFLKMGETIFDPEFPLLKMSSLQAGLSQNWQRRIQDFQHARQRNIKEWMALFPPAQKSLLLQGNEELPDLIRFPWKISSQQLRQDILATSDRLGLGISATYPDSVDGIPELGYAAAGKGYPVAKELAATLVTLPVHPLLAAADIVKIKELVSALLIAEERASDE